MNKRQFKKKNIANWILVKFTGDVGVYKICSNCLNYGKASYKLHEFKPIIEEQVPYCQFCGKRMNVHPLCKRTKDGFIKTDITIQDVWEGKIQLKDIFNSIKNK